MIEIENVGQVARQIDEWLAAVEHLATDVGRGLSIAAFEYALEIGPQYSGDFVANLRYSINQPDPTFKVDVLGANHVAFNTETQEHHADFNPFGQGDTPAREYALAQATGRATAFKLGDTVFISSAATHDEPYAILIENNQIKWRDVNQTYGGATFRQTAMAIGQRFDTIGADRAAQLKARSL